MTTHDADYGVLYFWGDTLNDMESQRIAAENRLRALRDDKGHDENAPTIKAAEAVVDQLKTLEHGVELNIKRTMRAHPLGEWCKRTPGVGEKQLARLLSVIGDPGEREKPSQLWAYCGLHVIRHRRLDNQTFSADDGHPGQFRDGTHIATAGVAPTRTRGQKANWSTEAKTRVYLIAEASIKAIGGTNKIGHTKRRSPYRDVYDEGREKYADAIHKVPCKRCGPSGSPAPAGSELSDGHKHARAMRLVMKRILLDLWKESRGGGEAILRSPPTHVAPTPAIEQTG